MAMSRKDFENIAWELRLAFPDDERDEVMWRLCCEAVARGCKQSNRAFSPDRFFQACERVEGARDY